MKYESFTSKSSFWKYYEKRERQRGCKYRYEETRYWRGKYYTTLEIDLYQKIGTKEDRESGIEIPDLYKQVAKNNKNSVEYFQCYYCKEEKHINNFKREVLVQHWDRLTGLSQWPVCDECKLQQEVDDELRRYCEERMEPIRRETAYIIDKLRKQKIPPRCRTYELIELERQILKTKRELKNKNNGKRNNHHRS
jgi:hypothetical protein